MPVNSEPDKDTGRYYCSTCFSFTIEEQLRLSGDDYTFYEDGTIFVDLPLEESVQEKPQKEEDSNEHFS